MNSPVEMTTIDRQELRETGVAAIADGIQVPDYQAEQVYGQLEYGHLSGKLTHGFVRIPWLVAQPLSGHETPTFEEATNAITYADCSKSVGYLAASEITSYITDRLDTQPMQTVVARNIFPTNTLSYHVRELCADSTAIGVIFGTTPKLVTGPGMDKKTLGTNPLAIGFSHKGTEVVTDITTASASLGELLVAKHWGGFDGSGFRTSANAIPQTAGELYENGSFTGSIAQQVENQAQRRLYALNIMLQMVTGLVANTVDNRGNLVIMGINKSVFEQSDMLPPIDPSLLPGARSHERFAAADKQPTITLPATLWREIQALQS